MGLKTFENIYSICIMYILYCRFSWILKINGFKKPTRNNSFCKKLSCIFFHKLLSSSQFPILFHNFLSWLNITCLVSKFPVLLLQKKNWKRKLDALYIQIQGRFPITVPPSSVSLIQETTTDETVKRFCQVSAIERVQEIFLNKPP